MSQPYLQGPALVMACSSGQGAIVIVEGETYQEDRYYYSQWFDDRAREISFFPQNGWNKVVAAVADLRRLLPQRDVFGIIDRDFAPDAVLVQQARTKPGDHVFRTPCFTVENYLLAPAGWLKVLKMLMRGELPAGWQTEADVGARITEAYEACLDLTAFNYTVRQEYDRLPGGGLDYKKHPKAIAMAATPPEAELLQWGSSRSAPVALDVKYQQNKAFVRALPRDAWPQWLTGKVVLKVFLEGFPTAEVTHNKLVASYIYLHPTPPPDLTALVTRIIERRGHP